MTRALYDRIGVGYSRFRRPDPRIAVRITAALGHCRSVLNVGAGTGSYEPEDRYVIAVEPSALMNAQRGAGATPLVQASADRLPFLSQSFDAALAILTIHHWSRCAQGLAEMRRVARERVVIFTWDLEQSGFWLLEQYFPEILEMERGTFPSLGEIEAVIGPAASHPVPVPADCSDGFLGAYWQRPEEYLDPDVRGAISTFSKLDPTVGLARLRRDLAQGTWLAEHGALKARAELDIGYRLIVADYR